MWREGGERDGEGIFGQEVVRKRRRGGGNKFVKTVRSH